MPSSMSAIIANKFGTKIHTDSQKSAPAAEAKPAPAADQFVRTAAQKKAGHNLPPELLHAARRYFGAVKAFAK